MEREALSSFINGFITGTRERVDNMEIQLNEIIKKQEELKVLLDLIQNAPIVDAKPVIHAKWLRTDAYPHHVSCSNCYKNYVTNEEIIVRYCTEAEYCPHCGAKMDN